jgi:hypothetical protein
MAIGGHPGGYVYNEANHPRDHRGRWIKKDMGRTEGEALTPEEILALEEYSDALARNINNGLRVPLDRQDETYFKWLEHHQATIDMIDSAISKQVLKEDIMVFRGLTEAQNWWLTQLEEGDIVRNPAFMSTTANRSKAFEFASGKFSADKSIELEPGNMMEIRVPKGVNALDLTSIAVIPEEQEILFPRNTRVRYIGHTGPNVGGTEMYQFELIPPNAPDN